MQAATKTSLALATTLIAGAAGAEGVYQPIKFARNKSSAVIANAVVRGDRDRYTLGARKGQVMDVRITSIEKNAVFDLYRPGAKSAYVDGGLEVSGKALAGESMRWTGKLPESGTYLLVVGGTRGNATYKLHVSIR